ncbi:TPA: hypothetical protein RI752_003558 [Vibrio cholerae]|uniref:hypothetical protein n=5 Tax=Vibrio cholerae TaxID=666 RepID=UPI0011596816|nr:hypothetical protein [Vibrio cholerae]TQP87879.1 hypothetical protein FLL87_17140 [Vibrio cholerae]HDV5391072.1 hypothetical protein [Vibrio cholerae]HDV5398213.1 hypothetical protein [Vibrio cholerae]HDV5412713.1 hypothetical protein [Vibrio cholerae]HDV5420270.1 hypothetical protein [Vibrio cholerae]
MECVLEEGFWAVIGAFLGAFLGLVTSIFLDYKRCKLVETSLYQEADFISNMMSSFFIALVMDHKKETINLYGGDSIIAPREIKFDSFFALHMELYKTRSIPSYDHRKLVHNIEYQWSKILSLDSERVVKRNGQFICDINKDKSKQMIYILVDMLYFLDLFVKNKSKFKFSENNANAKIDFVLSKYEINSNEILALIKQE